MDCLRPWRAFRSRSNQLRFEVNAALLCRTSSAHAGLYNTRRRHKKKKKHKNKKKGKREKVTMRCQLEFRSRSHLIAKLSTIRQLTSKISCKLSIMDNNRETIVLLLDNAKSGIWPINQVKRSNKLPPLPKVESVKCQFAYISHGV